MAIFGRILMQVDDEHLIPEPLADAALDFLYPMLDQLKGSNVFGPPIAPPEDSSAMLRFLGLLGRNAWS